MRVKVFVEQCQQVGDDGCDLLNFHGDAPWCGACGCASALKRGCPQSRW
jgi:hypothetical protein